MFFTFAVGQVPFSQAMKDLLGPQNAPYYSGAIAQLFISKYFALHVVCGIIALLHHTAERLYLGRPPQPRTFSLLVALLCCGLVGGFWFQPKLKHLHTMKYAPNLSEPVRNSAARSFKIWHATSQILNLLVIGGLSLYVWRVNNPSDPTRTISHMHVRG